MGNDKDTFVPGMFDLVSSEDTGLVSNCESYCMRLFKCNPVWREGEGLGFSIQVQGCTVYYILLQSVAYIAIIYIIYYILYTIYYILYTIIYYYIYDILLFIFSVLQFILTPKDNFKF